MQQGFELFASHEILSVSLNGAAGTQSKRCFKKTVYIKPTDPRKNVCNLPKHSPTKGGACEPCPCMYLL